MPRFISPDGKLTLETAVPSEAVSLRQQGFKEQKARTTAVREADAEVAATVAPANEVEAPAEAKSASRSTSSKK